MQVSLYWSVVNLWLKTLPIRKHDIFFTRTKGQTNNYTHTQWNSYFTRKACSITRCSGARREVYCMPRYGQNLNNLDTLIGTEPIIFFLTSAASNFFFFLHHVGEPPARKWLLNYFLSTFETKAFLSPIHLSLFYFTFPWSLLFLFFVFFSILRFSSPAQFSVLLTFPLICEGDSLVICNS